MISDLTNSICVAGTHYTKDEILDNLYEAKDYAKETRDGRFYLIADAIYDAFACRKIDNVRITNAFAIYFEWDGQLSLMADGKWDGSENAIKTLSFDWETYLKARKPITFKVVTKEQYKDI